MSDIVFFTNGWMPLLRVVVVGVCMYLALVVLLRASGGRTIASMNAFDFIATVAIGSAFGRALTAKDVALVEAILAFAVLISLQYLVARSQVRSRTFARAVTNAPQLLFFQGSFLPDAMKQARVTEQELRSMVRKKGQGGLDGVEALVLEASGDIAVVKKLGDGSAFGPDLLEQIDEQDRRNGGA